VAALPPRDAATREFIARRLGDRRFTPVDVDAQRGLVVVRQMGWRFVSPRSAGSR
jgi:hypothetical protein